MDKQAEYSMKFNKTGVETFTRIKNPMNDQIKETSLGIMSYDDFREKIKNTPLNITITKLDLKIENDGFIWFGLCGLKFLQSQDVQDQKPITEGLKLLVFDNEKKPWRAYNDLLIFTAKWLYENGRLQIDCLPVFVPNGKRYLINSKPFHDYLGKDGKPKKFDGTPIAITKDMWLNTNFDSGDCKLTAEYLMRRFAPEISFKILGFNHALS